MGHLQSLGVPEAQKRRQNPTSSWVCSHAVLSAGVWVGAGCSLSEVRSLLEKLLPQYPEEKTELFRALIQQLRNLGNQQIRNVAVNRLGSSPSAAEEVPEILLDAVEDYFEESYY